jgi:predicted Zn-ribbon and HTH transcriptional regulator
MRLGLRGQVRRVLAPKGVKVIQRVQLTYTYRYLLLAVEPLQGELRWRWVERMNAATLLPVLEDWKLPAVVWDGAPAHRSSAMETLSTRRIRQPAYAPELNPAERVFEEVRRWTEGKVYESLDEKQRAADRYLKRLQADPERVKRLCGWDWIEEALHSLPPAEAA